MLSALTCAAALLAVAGAAASEGPAADDVFEDAMMELSTNGGDASFDEDLNNLVVEAHTATGVYDLSAGRGTILHA